MLRKHDPNPDVLTGHAVKTGGVTEETLPDPPRQQTSASEGEPLLEVPAERLPKGHTQESVHHHELGHYIVMSAEGLKPGEIISHHHRLLKDKPLETGGITWSDLPYVTDFDRESKYTPEEILADSRKWLTAYLGGAAANELIDGIKLEDNKGLDGDFSRIRGLLEEHLGIKESAATKEIADAYDRAKTHLTPKVIDIIRETAKTREKNLDLTLHYSAERLIKIAGELYAR
jgi:hypothetical protein